MRPTFPGVHIEEVPSGIRPIVGVATSITAFIGRARRGAVDDPVHVHRFADYSRIFGDLWLESTMGHAVHQFFRNGGTDAIIVRVFNGDDGDGIASVALAGGLTLMAASPGAWGNRLRVTVDYNISEDIQGTGAETETFNLIIEEMPETGSAPVATETFCNVSVHADATDNVELVLLKHSRLACVSGALPADRPNEVDAGSFAGGVDGPAIGDSEIVGSRSRKTGMYALEGADLFNLMCIPPLTPDVDVDPVTFEEALAYCEQRRAFLIVDPPNSWVDVAAAVAGTNDLALSSANAAIYFPRIKVADPVLGNQPAPFAPGGTVAGIYARTDAESGVWKAPAGREATMRGVLELTHEMTHGENSQLNPLGVNCLRAFPGIGTVVWGARTLAAAGAQESEWRYVPVRRTALFIEETLHRGLQWAVFEPNGEPLWSQIRRAVESFMQTLFRRGAFQGASAAEAYFVKCDSETTTQVDINLGVVNLLVGFAPLKPAEFVVIKIKQIAGQTET